MSKKKNTGAPGKSVIDQLGEMDQASSDAYNNLFQQLMRTKTLAELYGVVDDDFKAEVTRLPEVAGRALRDAFAAQRDVVKHKVGMDALANIPVTVKDPPDFPPHSPDFPDSVFCVIKGVIDSTGEKFECVSGAVRIVRHFQNSKLESYPQKLVFYREDADSMQARGAKPVQLKDGTMGLVPMWLVRRMAPPVTRANAGADGIPF